MKRLAAHYVLLPDDRLLKQHYVELDDENHWLGVFPLDKEICNTVFYNIFISFAFQFIFVLLFLNSDWFFLLCCKNFVHKMLLKK